MKKQEHNVSISLDNETHRLLLRRAEQCEGNKSKAARMIIVESVDHAAGVRGSIHQELNVIVRALGQLRAATRVPGSGKFIEQIERSVMAIEDKLAKVTTT